MVNKSPLFKLNELNNSINKKMKPWSERTRYSNGILVKNIKKMKKKIRNLLSTISGDNITEMLKG
jgi:hypothetical protein